MAHDDEFETTGTTGESSTTEQTAHRARHLAGDGSDSLGSGADTVESTDGEYTSTDGVSHTAGDQQGSYVDTSSHEESSTEKGSYVDSEGAGPDSDAEGEYTDRDE